ncbi:uncharacterized protein [Cicer arietinum]|uniref:G3BP-like protein n=1 Tax=Cicer arietinum TaxID=3827 RepID=A0A1S2XWK0_CICAR|nr:putative G3BP-like protein [Cicer arietinum]
MENMPPPEQVGAFFAPQYYGLLSKEPNCMHHFYAEHSTMILVNADSITTASELDQIHTLIMSLNFVTIDISSIKSLECWGGGVLLVVSGSVKIKDATQWRKFIHTMYLAPQGDGYFVMNDILHLIDDHHVTNHTNLVVPVSSEDIDPRFHSEHPPPATDTGNLDESVVKKIDDLMSLMVNHFDFPSLPRPRSRSLFDLQTPPTVSEPLPTHEEASSSNSSSVANADTVHESVAATKIEETSSSNSSSVANADTVNENVDATKIEPVVVQEEPSQISYKSILVSPTSASTPRGRGNIPRGRGSDDSNNNNKGKGKSGY